MDYHIALIVGRFQPFHKGHLFLIKEALKVSDKLVFGIGSASIYDENNPLNYKERKKMIEIVINEEKISNRVVKIVPLDDFFDDKKWLENLEKQVGKFDLALGNNDWTNKILEKAGHKVLNVNYYKRALYEGWRIRKLMKEGKKWQDRVPKYLIDFVSNYPLQPTSYNLVVIGGTFDHFHKGHRVLLQKAFKIGKKITIGIATKKIYKNKFLSETVEPYEIRKKSVENYIKKYLVNGRIVDIIPFSEFTGGADRNKNIDAIVVSKRTYPNAFKINQMREKNNLPALKIVIIDDVLGEDGKLISSERIRAGEIDTMGKKYQILNIKDKKELVMPDGLRPILQKPLGQVFDEVYKVIKFIKFIKPIQIIAIGDIIVNSLLKLGIDPDVKIIDFRSRRRVIPAFTLNKIEGKAGIHINIPLIKSKMINNPGTINLKTAGIIKEKITNALYKKMKSWILVEGEEDLLALPAILFAPLKSLVLYGHWQFGIIMIKVDEEIKNQVRNMIKKFL